MADRHTPREPAACAQKSTQPKEWIGGKNV